MSEAQRIADSLSEAQYLTQAQKNKLLAIGDGQPVEFPLHSSGLFLIERGFVFVNELGARHLTDLGHAVRAYLQQKEPLK